MRSMSYHLRRVSVRRYAARTRMVILNSPNNPSGAAYSARDLAALAEVLVRHPDVVVLTDEIYEHLVYDGFETASIAAVDPRLAPRTITCNGMAKGYGMTGWRIGFAGGPRELIRAIADLQSQNVNAPSTIGQHAAVAALDGPQAYLAERAAAYQARRDLAVARLDAIPGLACHRPEGAFYLFPSCAGVIGKCTPDGRRIDTDFDFVTALLDAEAVATVHGGAFGLSPHFRIAGDRLSTGRCAAPRPGHARLRRAHAAAGGLRLRRQPAIDRRRLSWPGHRRIAADPPALGSPGRSLPARDLQLACGAAAGAAGVRPARYARAC